jgi:hypothetical protein
LDTYLVDFSEIAAVAQQPWRPNFRELAAIHTPLPPLPSPSMARGRTLDHGSKLILEGLAQVSRQKEATAAGADAEGSDSRHGGDSKGVESVFSKRSAGAISPTKRRPWNDSPMMALGKDLNLDALFGEEVHDPGLFVWRIEQFVPVAV